MIIRISSLIESLAETVDLVSSEVNNHHRRVACIASYLGDACGLHGNRYENLILAAALHDIGGLRTHDRLDLLSFDENSGTHAEYGYMLLKRFRPFAHIAPMIRYHHTFWNWGKQKGAEGEEIPLESQIIFLADRVSVLMKPDFSLYHVEEIRERIKMSSGKMFMPALVDMFEGVSKVESFWLDARDAFSKPLFESALARNLHLEEDDLMSLGKLYSQIIDFRSSFTASHSSGVSVVAEMLAGHCGFSRQERVMMRLAGYLHDIGKLIVPEGILEKPAALSKAEFDKIRCHTYYTNRLLLGIQEFDTIRAWAAMHHERLDGKGYPFHLSGDKLPLGARIMAVADVFVAVMEDRPYRMGMEISKALELVSGMARSGALDEYVVEHLVQHVSEIDRHRKEEQQRARQEYSRFYSATPLNGSGQVQADAIESA